MRFPRAGVEMSGRQGAYFRQNDGVSVSVAS
jgi:hypothetical protein